MALIALNSPYHSRYRSRRLSPVARNRWQGRLLTGAGLALLPWMGYLAATLPPAQAAAWVALDTMEAACLLSAGGRLLRGEPGHGTGAGLAAVLLTVDACVDVATAGPGAELLTALAMAVAAELPLAALCAALAVRAAGKSHTGRSHTGRRATPHGAMPDTATPAGREDSMSAHTRPASGP
ncbi:hypothetical protein [Streptomyces sp. MST-110588]|uniref:hypothetical protein n=1 Tax=Streptomyces sp. MST-110588 TaxID=2833628 RepID=UPI001F5D0AF6|nr:hypothetical protein [Streptomyces sp. MST-110588]